MPSSTHCPLTLPLLVSRTLYACWLCVYVATACRYDIPRADLDTAPGHTFPQAVDNKWTDFVETSRQTALVQRRLNLDEASKRHEVMLATIQRWRDPQCTPLWLRNLE
jgi:hypothetical protein